MTLTFFSHISISDNQTTDGSIMTKKKKLSSTQRTKINRYMLNHKCTHEVAMRKLKL